MRDHFSYLVDDDAAEFFQRAACDEVAVEGAQPVVVDVEKTAAATTYFEKISNQLDRHLEILLVSGECGVNAGMQKRADTYVDMLLERVDLDGEQFGELFDKIAGVAIQRDLDAVYSQYVQDLPDGLHGYVEEALAKVATDVVALALQEKEAGVGSFLGRLFTRGGGGELRAGLGAAKEVGKVGTLGAARAVGGAGKAVGRTIARPFQAAARGIKGEMTAFRNARRAKMLEAPAKIEANLAKARAAAEAGGVRGVAARGATKSLEKDLSKATAARNARLDAVDKGWDGKAPTPASRNAPAAAAKASGEAKTVRAEGERAKAQSEAAAAATPKGPAAAAKEEGGRAKLQVIEGGKGKGTGTDGPAPAAVPKAKDADIPPPPGGAEGKPAGFMDAWRKLSTDGWKGLSKEEKGTLMRGGVTAALAYRVITGKGAVSGGEGVV